MRTDQGPNIDRRRLLAVLGTATATGLAGCNSGDDEGPGEENGSVDDGSSNTPTPTSTSTPTPVPEPDLSLDVNEEAETWEGLIDSLSVDGEYDEASVRIQNGGEEYVLDDLDSVGEEAGFVDSAGEYDVTLEVLNGDTEFMETVSVDVDWTLPEGVEREDWNEILEEAGLPQSFYGSLTDEQGFTEQGEKTLEVIGSNSLTDSTRTNIVKEVIQKNQLTEYDIGILQTLVTNPEGVRKPGRLSETSVKREFSDYGLEQTGPDSELDMTLLEKELIFNITDESELDHVEELHQLRDKLINYGYNQTEVDFLRNIGKYDSKTINNFYPRMEQAKDLAEHSSSYDQGVFEYLLENDNDLTNVFAKEVSDLEDNGLISARDPSPEEFSATPDPFGSGLVKDGLGDEYDPEEPLAVFYYEISNESNDDEDMVNQAIEVARQEYEEAGIQTLWLEGSNNAPSLGSASFNTLGDRMRDIPTGTGTRSDIIKDLPAHYVLFDEYEETDNEYTSWGINADRVATVHTDPYLIPGEPQLNKQNIANWATMAETLDNLVYNYMDVPYRRDVDPSSESGKKSWTSFYKQYDEDFKEIPQNEVDMIMDDELNYGRGDKDLQRKVLSSLDEPIGRNPSVDVVEDQLD